MARGLRGVKDDLSEIARQILDIACFLSPFLATTTITYATDSPPSSPTSPNPNISDLPDIGAGFRTGISRLSSVLRRPGLAKDSRDSTSRAGTISGGPSGIREEIIAFVRDLVKCPTSWLEFPLPVNDDFDMSRDQEEHIAAVEHLVPSLAALRISICPSYMNEESFWKIYFALLHPKLNKNESEFLSTQQIVEEMHMNLKKMESRLNSESADTSSSKTCSMINEINEEDVEVHVPAPNTESRSLQYFDRWFERDTPGEAGSSTHTRPQLSSKEESEVEDDNIVLLNKYKSSSSFEAASFDNSPFSSYERLQLLEKTFPKDYHGKPLHRRHNRDTTDEETSSWHAVEDSSDFEMVDKS